MSLETHLDADSAAYTLVLRGELDIETRAVALARGSEALKEMTPGQQLIIDLSEVSFVDSSGLGALVALSNEATAAHCTILMLRPSPAVAQLFALTALDKAFDIERDPAAD